MDRKHAVYRTQVGDIFLWIYYLLVALILELRMYVVQHDYKIKFKWTKLLYQKYFGKCTTWWYNNITEISLKCSD